jgi:hypothetical protein
MYNDVFSHTRLTILPVFIIRQIVSTASIGHPQATVLERERMRKLSTMRNYLLVITRKKYSKKLRTVHRGIFNCNRPKDFKNCINVDENTKYKKFMYMYNMDVVYVN